jgi:hypothetical protein
MENKKYATRPTSLISASQNSASPKVSTPRSWNPRKAAYSESVSVLDPPSIPPSFCATALYSPRR